MDENEDFTPSMDPATVCRLARSYEAGLRALHKRLRRDGSFEASQAALEGADSALAVVRAITTDEPPPPGRADPGLAPVFRLAR